MSVTKKPGTWQALRGQLEQLHQENAVLREQVDRIKSELEGAIRARNYTGELLEKYKRHHAEVAVPLGPGVEIHRESGSAELLHRITTAQALGSLVIARVVEDERGGTRIELWAHRMMQRTVL